MKPPIIADEHGDIHVFDTIEKASRFLEPIDVKNGEYVVYDSEGRLLTAGVESSRPQGFWGLLIRRVEQTVLKAAEIEPTHQEEMRQKLIAFLRLSGAVESTLSHATLPNLIERLQKG